MEATWDDNDEKTSHDKEQQEMSNLALFAIEDDELDKVNDLTTYD